MTGNDSILVSVLMPVFNGGNYLREAINSILSQTHTNLQLVIINDGSTDNSDEIVRSLNDARVTYHINETNLGLIATLNKGITLCKGKYIARMDADDISLPNRIEKQLTFLESHPDVGVCGAWIKVFGDQNFIRKLPANDDEIKMELLFRSPIAHPAAMIRTEILAALDGPYRKEYPAAEDYDLWSRLSRITQLHNLPEVLLLYRFHSTQITATMTERKESTRKQIQKNNLSSIGIDAGKDELDLHYDISEGGTGKFNFSIEQCEHWLIQLEKKCRHNVSCRKIISSYWLRYVAAKNNSIQGAVRSFRSNPGGLSNTNAKDAVRVLRSIFRRSK